MLYYDGEIETRNVVGGSIVTVDKKTKTIMENNHEYQHQHYHHQW